MVFSYLIILGQSPGHWAVKAIGAWIIGDIAANILLGLFRRMKHSASAVVSSFELEQDEAYSTILKELDGENRDDAAYARAFVDAEGSEEKARSYYVKHRVRRLDAKAKFAENEKSKYDDIQSDLRNKVAEAIETKNVSHGLKTLLHEEYEAKLSKIQLAHPGINYTWVMFLDDYLNGNIH